MLLRAVGRNASKLISLTRQPVSVRSISVTSVVSGGGHHHHDPLPVYVPQPGSLEWKLVGNPTKRISEDSQYKPGADDFASFFGAFVFVGLTILAVTCKTDTFKKSDNSHGHSESHHTSHEAKSSDTSMRAEERSADQTPIQTEPTSVTQEPPQESKPAAINESKGEDNQECHSKECHEKDDHGKEPEQKSESEQDTVDVGTVSATPEPATEKQAAEAPSANNVSSRNEQESEETASTKPNEGPLHCEYVIIGSGTAAYYASLAIRAKQGEAKVLMIGEEEDLPYNRPPLSKELFWYGDENSTKGLDYVSLSGKKRDIYFEAEGFFVKPDRLSLAEHGGVSLIRGKKVVKICEKDKLIYLNDGSTVGYEKVLIATGIRPKRERLFDDASAEAKDRITYYHYPSDFKRVARLLNEGSVKKVSIVGNSLLAAELAYSIKRKYENVEVHQVLEGEYNAQEILPKHLAMKSTEAMQKMGVNVHNNQKVEGVRKCCKDVVMKLKNGTELRSDLIIVANGEEVNNEIGESSGLKINKENGGIVADKTMKVGNNIWAAGAVVSFEDAVLGTRRLNTWEHAQVSGRLAGSNMVVDEKNGGEAFWYQPSFFTKFAPNYHFNAIGNIDSRLDTVSVYSEKTSDDDLERAVIFYTKAGKVVGVLLVNVFGPSLDVARRIIDDKKTFDDFKELSKLFPLYEMPKDDDEADQKKQKD